LSLTQKNGKLPNVLPTCFLVTVGVMATVWSWIKRHSYILHRREGNVDGNDATCMFSYYSSVCDGL